MNTTLNKKMISSLIVFSLITMSQKAETKIPDTTQTDAEIAVAKAQAIAIEKANAVSTEKSSTNPVALKCAEMDLLNELLALIPMNVLRMKSSYKTAAGILKTVKSRTNAISKEIKAKLDSTPYLTIIC